MLRGEGLEMRERIFLSLSIITALMCVSFIGCGNKEKEPIYNPDAEQAMGSRDLYDIGGKAEVPEVVNDEEYVSPFGPQPVEGIKWASSLQAARASAKPGSNTKILVWFTNSDCTECRRIERDVFSTDIVLEQAPKYIWVRFDTDANPEKTEYYIKDNKPPVMMWMDYNGNSYHVLYGGFDDPETLAKYLLDWH